MKLCCIGDWLCFVCLISRVVVDEPALYTGVHVLVLNTMSIVFCWADVFILNILIFKVYQIGIHVLLSQLPELTALLKLLAYATMAHEHTVQQPSHLSAALLDRYPVFLSHGRFVTAIFL